MKVPVATILSYICIVSPFNVSHPGEIVIV